MRARAAALAALLAALALLCGCTTLPDSGSVHREASVRSAGEAPYFAPPGPARGASQEQVVEGFLLAMQANPLTTATARGFLSRHARAEWRPNEATVVYDASSVAPGAHGVVARLSDAHRLDARGGWVGGMAAGQGSTERSVLRLVLERGEWRIDNPENALVVPESYFESRFTPFELYFLDSTQRVLVPDTVYVPRGEQTASNLVRGLLAGPGSALAPVTRTAFPAGTDLDLSVVVSDDGVAEVPLSQAMLRLTPSALGRAEAQLAWTLRQVPGISRVRLTVEGAPVPLPGGGTDFSVDAGEQYDPQGHGATGELVGFLGGRVEQLSAQQADPTPFAGPFAAAGYAVRSLALSQDGTRVAATGVDGRTVLSGATSGRLPARRVLEGRALLRPAYDALGELWVVDSGPSGARVRLVGAPRDERSARVLRLPGITGSSVAAFALARDGTRIAVLRRGSGEPTVLVAGIVRDGAGRVLRVTRPRTLPLPQEGLGAGVDLGWDSPSTVALLTRTTGDESRVTTLEADGSPGDGTPEVTETLSERSVALAVSPGEPPVVLTADHRVFALSSGRWVPQASATGAMALAYPG